MIKIESKAMRLNANVLVAICIIISAMQLSSAAHYIAGSVDDALDGESADGKMVFLWNPANGPGDNISDTVGPSGNSGVSNTFLLDCELLGSACQTGDTVSVQVIDGDYLSNLVNITVSLSGFDAADNLSLNSPPYPGLILPENNGDYPADIDFNCSYFDYDDDIQRVGLWGNWLGSFQEIAFQNLGPASGYAIFSQTLSQGNYIWNCLVEDSFGIFKFSGANNSFFVDDTPPVLTSVSPATGSVCGYDSIEVSCYTYDADLDLSSVIIQANPPSGLSQNYSASFVLDDEWNASVAVDEVGNWTFTCFSNDSVGNSNSLESSELLVESGYPELYVVGDDLNFIDTPTYEGQQINVSVDIGNSGCVSSGNFNVSFFDESYPTGNNFANTTINIAAHSTGTTSALFTLDIGFSNIFSYVDLYDVINEDNESNNYANKTIYLKSWQKIFGNLSLDKILRGDGTNLSLWEGEVSFGGNVFIADVDSEVDWLNLQAIGKTKTGTDSSGDFVEIDTFLGTSGLNDSVYNIFTSSGSPIGLTDFYVFQNHIADTPYINSSSQGNFLTGILWDTSDSLDGEYDSLEKEDVVFVTQINQGAVGEYGTYDYEIDIPSRLRSYGSNDESQVYLYYDLN